MKNITVCVDDETYRLSRVRAAAAGTSVSALVRSLLERVAGDEAPLGSQSAEFERLERLQDEVLTELQGRSEAFSAADRLPREALYRR
jgi:plasmid stability protein